MQSDKKTVIFVPVESGKQGKDVFDYILGKDIYADFRKTNEAGNVVYTFEFYGKDLSGDQRDINLNLETSTTPFEGCTYGNSSNSLYVTFAETGTLPAGASTYLNVGNAFSNGDTLYLYAYNNGNLTLLQDNIKVSNGYASFELISRRDLILSTEKWDTAADEENTMDQPKTEEADEESEASGQTTVTEENQKMNFPVGALVGIIAAIAAGAGAAVYFVRKKE